MKKILLVRLSSMGDLIHTLPAVSDLALARNQNGIQLDWLCEEGFADIARLHSFVHDVIPMNWRKWRKQGWAGIQEVLKLRQILLSREYDCVVDSQGLLKSAVFGRLANAPMMMGLDWHSAREPLASCFYGAKFAVEKGRDAVWRNRVLFSQIFDYNFDVNKVDFGVDLLAGTQNGHSGSLLKLSTLPPPSQNYAMALHATSRDSKLWRVDYWVDFLRRMHEWDNLPVYLTWGNEVEYQRAMAIAAECDFVRVCPKLSLGEAAYWLAGAKWVVGVDTGLLHLANAVNVPVVGVFTDTDPQKTGVQTSAHSVNLGGVAQMPTPEAVVLACQTCVANRIAI